MKQHDSEVVESLRFKTRWVKTTHGDLGKSGAEKFWFASEILSTNVEEDSEWAPYLIFVYMEDEVLVLMHHDGEIDDDEFLILYEASR